MLLAIDIGNTNSVVLEDERQVDLVRRRRGSWRTRGGARWRGRLSVWFGYRSAGGPSLWCDAETPSWLITRGGGS